MAGSGADRLVAALVGLPLLASVAALVWSEPLGGWWASGSAHLTLIAPAAVLCLLGALGLVAAAWSARSAEITVLGASLAALSVLALANGLGPWLGDEGFQAGRVAGLLALPVALAVAAPILFGRSRAGRRMLRCWRWWVAGGVAASVALAVGIVVVGPGMPPAAVRVALTISAAAGATALAARHLRLHRLGRRRASAVAAVALTVLAGAALASGLGPAHTPVWWAAHLFDNLAVFVAVGAAVVLVRRQASVSDVLGPVVARDPGVALELGLSGEIHAFVATLDRKDPSTRDHVVRVAELATRVGERAGLSVERLRSLGLGGLLHDIGKLVVPSDVLTKRSSLTDDEYAVIKSHAARGARLLEGSPMLVPVQPLVRWHHERHDGQGYPDGLRDEEIPFEVAIVSVVDAWDAMTNDRHYRDGIGGARAREVLLAEAGHQWHPRAVRLLLEELRAGRATAAFAATGRSTTDSVAVTDESVCADALPDAADSRSDRFPGRAS